MYSTVGASRSRVSVSTVTRKTCLILTDNLPLFPQLVFHATRVESFPCMPDNCLKLARHTIDVDRRSRIAFGENLIGRPFERIARHHIIQSGLHGMSVYSHHVIITGQIERKTIDFWPTWK